MKIASQESQRGPSAHRMPETHASKSIQLCALTARLHATFTLEGIAICNSAPAISSAEPWTRLSDRGTRGAQGANLLARRQVAASRRLLPLLPTQAPCCQLCVRWGRNEAPSTFATRMEADA